MTPTEIKNRIRHMLIDGHILLMDNGVQLRYLDQDQEFEQDDVVYGALESGIFTTEWGGRWMNIGDFKSMEKRYFDPIIEKDPKEFEGLYIGWAAGKVLKEMARERRRGLYVG